MSRIQMSKQSPFTLLTSTYSITRIYHSTGVSRHQQDQDHPAQLYFSIVHHSLKCHCTGQILRIRTSPFHKVLCNFLHLEYLSL